MVVGLLTPCRGVAGDREAGRIIAMERAALDRWGKGDPQGYLDSYAADISYFDPQQDKRVDGLDAMKALLAPIARKVQIKRSEVVNPPAQIAGSVAVLTFQFVSEGNEGQKRWNCTEVYRRTGKQWRIIHQNWTFAHAPRR